METIPRVKAKSSGDRCKRRAQAASYAEEPRRKSKSLRRPVFSGVRCGMAVLMVFPVGIGVEVGC